MGYEASLKKAWAAVREATRAENRIIFLNEEYEVIPSQGKVLSLPARIEPKDYYKILILHYLANEDKVLDIDGDDFISFKEMEGGEVYFSAFRKRAIGPILKKYGDNPALMFERADLLPAERIRLGNAALSIRIFPKIKAQVVLWAKDEEFEADCSMLFNRSARMILPTEDIAVLGGITASLLTR